MKPKELVDAAVTPLSAALREAGFKKSVRRFHKDAGEARMLLEVQASQWNQENSARFTINLAVYVPSILRKLGEEVGPPPKSEVGCTWGERIGFVTPERLDRWWQLDGEESVANVSSQVVDTVRRYALPWLETAATYEGLCRILAQSNGIPAADMLWSLGLHSEATACVKGMPLNSLGRVQAAAEWLQAHVP